jgi:PAS domain-containing protein
MNSAASARALDFLAGGGEMGARMRIRDWSLTPVGAPEDWPQSLKTAIRLILNNGHPMLLFWGPRLIQFYNDAFRQLIGADRHPSALGQEGRRCWDEVWAIVGSQIEQVMSGRGSVWQENMLVPITRDGKLQDVYWTYSYSPIDDPLSSTGIGGVLVVCSDTTASVLANRRLAFEREQFVQLFEQAPVFMATLQGADHRFELVNPAYLKLIGHRDVVGKTVAEALPEAVDQGYVDLLDQVYASGQAFAAGGREYSYEEAPGGPRVQRQVDFVYQPIKNLEGRSIGVFVVGVDLTDRMPAAS